MGVTGAFCTGLLADSKAETVGTCGIPDFTSVLARQSILDISHNGRGLGSVLLVHGTSLADTGDLFTLLQD